MATAALSPVRLVASDLPGVAEQAYVVCVLLLASGAFLNLGSNPQVDTKDGMPLMQALWATAYLVLIVLLTQKSRGCLRALTRQPFLCLPVLWAVASVFWSGEPGLTFRKALALVLTTLFGAYVGLRFSLSEFLRLLAIMCGFVVVSSLIFGVLQLGTPVDNTPGWFGIFVQKNSLGRMMAFSVLVFLLASRIKWSNANPLKAGLVLCIVLLALSRSMTGVAAAMLIILFIILAPVLRNRLWKLIVSLAGLSLAGTAIITWVLSNLQLVSDLIGRSVTLTGRLELWAVCFYMALRQPWLGYGYSAFWLGLNGPSRIVWQIIRWHPPHPHNGLLSVWLDLGLIGAALVTIAYFVCVTKAVKFYRRTISREAIWPLTYLVFFLLANLTESSVLTANGIFWMLFVAVAISLGKREQGRTAAVANEEILP